VFSPRGTEGGWDVRDQPTGILGFSSNASPPPGRAFCALPSQSCIGPKPTSGLIRGAKNIPIIPLYLAKNGKRYRSLGDADITHPVASTASNIEEILVELDRTKVARSAPAGALDHENRRCLRAAAASRATL